MYGFDSRVRYSETDEDGILSVEGMMNYLQDCSTFQSEDNGVGVGPMQKRGLAWIIVYWRVEIHRMPALGENVLIGTAPYKMTGGMGLRNFLMETQDGERLARANSVWTLIDTNTKHPVRIPAEVLAKYPLEDGEIRSEYQFGISNEVLPGRTARVTVQEGRLLLVKVF